MRHSYPAALCGLLLAALGMAASTAAAQGWLKDVAENALKRETGRQVDRAVTGAVRCAAGEYDCYEKARSEGREVVFVDADGRVIEDADGNPVTDPARLPGQARTTATTGAGPAAVSANYDFEPGERVLFFDDYSGDVVGDFPRRLQLVEGSWDIVEVQGVRHLRALSSGALYIPLPETLPERFTIEAPVSLTHGNAHLYLTTDDAFYGRDRDYSGTAITVAFRSVGLHAVGQGPDAMAEMTHRFERDGLTTLRVMADGSYIKVYLGGERVSQAPNAVFPRTDRLVLSVSSAAADYPILIGPIRVAAGGRDLYEAIAAEGRVAVHDILFDTDAATIRPESAEVLGDIAAMLSDHPDLSLMVEGHTDSTGDFDHNMELSKARADAVKDWLIERHGIAAERLRTMGLGSTQPKDSNDSEAGRQQNRRVELVRIG
ncbi:MAG: OmpA family protein [Thermoanaerobaculia bacterium]